MSRFVPGMNNTHLDDCTRLPERDILVWILDGGDAAIRVNIRIRLLLEAFKLDPGCLVWEVKLFEYDQNLGGVGNLI